MTAYAYIFQPTRLVVAADTLAYVPGGGPLGFLDKISQLPRFHAVLLARGMIRIEAGAVADLSCDPSLTDLEDLAEELPDVLRRHAVGYCDEVGIDDHRSAVLSNVILAGWSQRERRMRMWICNNVNDFEMSGEDGDAYGLSSFPILPPEYMPRLAGAGSDSDLIAVIAGARRFFNDHPEHGAKAGGEVVTVTVERAAMAHRVVHRFADYEEARIASAAVRGRYGRGDADLYAAVRAGVTPADEAVEVDTRAPEAVPMPLTRQQRRAAERAARKGQRAA